MTMFFSYRDDTDKSRSVQGSANDDGTYPKYRLYVNYGTTATYLHGKGKTMKAVENFCKKHLGEEYTRL